VFRKTKVGKGGGFECRLTRKWLNVTGEVMCGSVEQNSTELRRVRKCLYNVGCKFENKITKPVMGVQEGDMEKVF
jgi:hypothetical protein